MEENTQKTLVMCKQKTIIWNFKNYIYITVHIKAYRKASLSFQQHVHGSFFNKRITGHFQGTP